MIVREIVQELEQWAPPQVAESYDNVGLLVGSPAMKVTGVLINLDMTEEIIEEAIAKGCNMIVAHHPIWFMPRKRLNGEDYVSRTIISAIKNDIALYAIHTNLDNIQTGVNKKICDRLGLQEARFLKPKDTEAVYGSGMIGIFPEQIGKKAFLQHVKEAFLAGGIRYADSHHTQIHKVAVCGGAGSFLIQDAIRQGADALVTSDITYHKFFDNEGKLLLLDIGHFESEQFTSELIRDFLIKKIPNFAVLLAQTVSNPIKYF